MKVLKRVVALYLFMIWLLFGGFGDIAQPKFLQPSEAFKVDAKKSGGFIDVNISLGDKIHIYAKDVHLKVVEPEQFEVEIDKPTPTKYEGDEVYYGKLNFHIPAKNIENRVAGEYKLRIEMSGCSDAGVCYQPQKFDFKFTSPNSTTSSTKPQSQNLEPEATQEGFFGKISRLSSEGNSAKIAKALAEEGLVFILLLFFVAGLLLALTPCILPMIPILSSIIIQQAGKDGNVDRKTSFLISLVYVVAMSITYAMIGVVAGLLGFDIQAHMNNPWIIIPMALLFVALAFSLFGYFKLELPQSWQSRLTKASDSAQGKGFVGTAIMGALSALIVGTCTAPVISGAIIFISMTNNALLGGLSLFVMGIGAGMPLLLVGAGANKLVPKPGGWMVRVSQIFGVMMLGMALYVLRGILSDGSFMVLMSLLLIGSAFYMGVFDDSSKRVGATKLFQVFAWMLLLFGSLLFVGGVTGGKSVLNPLEHFVAPKSGAVAVVKEESLENRQGYSLARLQKEIAKATAQGKPVVVDIGKKNCAACSELEHITFPDPNVKKALERFKFIQIDITQNTPQEQEILKKFHLFGAPNILFFDKSGKPLAEKFIVGFIKPEEFVKVLESIK
jgi:thiol:disulfide interchange protein DsbD